MSIVVKEPEWLNWDPTRNVPLKADQVTQLDPNDPITYRSIVQFPQPLPLDKLIALNEIQTRMSLGLESKEGALRALGEEFPAEKIQEIRQELMDDAKADGALQMLKNSIAQEIMSLTGMMPGPDGNAGQPIMDPQLGVPMGGQPNTATPILDEASQMTMTGEAALRNRLVTEAYGTKLPQRRPPKEYEK